MSNVKIEHKIVKYFSTLSSENSVLYGFIRSRDVEAPPHLSRLRSAVNLWRQIKNKFNTINEEEIKTWALCFTPFVNSHWGNERLYPTLRKSFFENLDKIGSLKDYKDDENLIDSLADLLIFAAVLEGVNDYGLDVPGESGTEPPAMRRYVLDQKVYSQLIFDLIGEDLIWEPRANRYNFASNGWRQWIANIFNQIRLFIVRNRRFFFAIAPLLDEYAPEYRQGLSLVEKHATFFIFSNLAWVFFIIRLLINLALIVKHLIFTSQISQFEANLSWETRLGAQLVMRWQELANDMAWFSCGIVTCFVLVGRAPIIGIYLAVAMQCYDLIIALTRLVIEQQRLQVTKQNYLSNLTPDSEEAKAFEKDFQVRISLEYNAVLFSVFMFLLLLICVLFTIPFFVSISPLFPVLGAITAVLITLVNIAGLRWFESKRSALYVGAQISNRFMCTLNLTECHDEIHEGDTIDPNKLDLGVFSRGFVRCKNKDGEDELWYVDKSKVFGPVCFSSNVVSYDSILAEAPDKVVKTQVPKPRILFNDQCESILEIKEIKDYFNQDLNSPVVENGTVLNKEKSFLGFAI